MSRTAPLRGPGGGYEAVSTAAAAHAEASTVASEPEFKAATAGDPELEAGLFYPAQADRRTPQRRWTRPAAVLLALGCGCSAAGVLFWPAGRGRSALQRTRHTDALISEDELLKTCAGVLDIEGWRSFNLINAMYNTPGQACDGTVEVPDWHRIVAKMGGRSYFGDMCSRNGFDPSEYVAINILGKTLSWTIDLSGAGCGCNAALYLASMRQNTNKSDCGDYYCDAASVCGVRCSEIDLQEANQFAFRSTLHLDDDHDGIAMGLGNGYTDWNSSSYGPGSKCIDTERPFQVAFSFPLDGKGGLAAVEVELSQDGGECRPLARISKYAHGKADGLAKLTKVMQEGMTPIVSYWSSEDMLWLDGHSCKITTNKKEGDESDKFLRSLLPDPDMNCTAKKPCNLDIPDRCAESVQFYDFSLEDMEPRQQKSRSGEEPTKDEPESDEPEGAPEGPEAEVEEAEVEVEAVPTQGEVEVEASVDAADVWGITNAPIVEVPSKEKAKGDGDSEIVQPEWGASTTTAKPAHRPPPHSPAPLKEFYMYRATSAQDSSDDPMGEVNTGNLDGVVWYLMNEVVTKYTNGTLCPRKHNISRLNRYKVKTRATKELYETGMNFGVRFAYDFGMCMGRCFPQNKCTGADDCRVHYESFGFNPGCNNFWDMYPFPDFQTSAPGGIWYSLPFGGRCEGEPTGKWNCTWSFEEAGSLTLEEIEATRSGGGNCCPAERCTSIWDSLFDDGATSERIRSILDLFEQRFPDMPRDLGQGTCDFDRQSWYADGTDNWPRRDPWAPETDEKDDSSQAAATTSKKEATTSKKQRHRRHHQQEGGGGSEEGGEDEEDQDKAAEGGEDEEEGEEGAEEVSWTGGGDGDEDEAEGEQQQDDTAGDGEDEDAASQDALQQDLVPQPVEETGDLPTNELPDLNEDDESTEYDCHDGLETWKDEWILSKALWCCKHEQLGCLDDFVSFRKLRK